MLKKLFGTRTDEITYCESCGEVLTGKARALAHRDRVRDTVLQHHFINR